MKFIYVLPRLVNYFCSSSKGHDRNLFTLLTWLLNLPSMWFVICIKVRENDLCVAV